MSQEKDYNDFSETDEMVEAFRPGSDTDEIQNLIGSDLQKILKYKNPITSIQHLVAFQMATLSFQNREVLKLLRVIKLLLFIIVAAAGVGVYKLVF